MKKALLICLLFAFSSTTFAQKSINNYKYIIVDSQFGFVKKVDQFQTSSLTKFLFNKYGFKAYLSTEDLNQEIQNNRCSALSASIKNGSGMLTTKLQIVLKDCNNNIVFTSIVGKSKEKEYKKTYHEAIRKAFMDPVIQGYSYFPLKTTTTNVTKIKDVVNPIDVIENMHNTKGNVKSPAKNKVSKPQIVKEKQSQFKKEAPNLTVVKKTINKEVESNKNVLYAQPIDGGFQLIDTTPKVVFKLLKTSNPNMFIIQDKNGFLTKGSDGWKAEYYENGKRIQKVYQVKF